MECQLLYLIMCDDGTLSNSCSPSTDLVDSQAFIINLKGFHWKWLQWIEAFEATDVSRNSLVFRGFTKFPFIPGGLQGRWMANEKYGPTEW